MAIHSLPSPINRRVLEGQVERRRSRRFDLHIPAICRSKDLRQSFEIGGCTRNVSSGGVFILGPVAAMPGTWVHLEVLLPPLETGQKELKLRCEGTVVRVERNGETNGFAVSNLEKGYVLGPA